MAGDDAILGERSPRWKWIDRLSMAAGVVWIALILTWVVTDWDGTGLFAWVGHLAFFVAVVPPLYSMFAGGDSVVP